MKRLVASAAAMHAALERIDILAGHVGRMAVRIDQLERRLGSFVGDDPDRIPDLETLVAEREVPPAPRPEPLEGGLADNMVAEQRVKEFKKKREVGYTPDEQARWDRLRLA